jgi:hypothetical protein
MNRTLLPRYPGQHLKALPGSIDAGAALNKHKSWCGLLLPVTAGAPAPKHRQEKRSILKMEFKGFLNALMQLPCQIVRTGRRIIYRLLAWNPWASSLLRLAQAMRRPLRC